MTYSLIFEFQWLLVDCSFYFHRMLLDGLSGIIRLYLYITQEHTFDSTVAYSSDAVCGLLDGLTCWLDHVLKVKWARICPCVDWFLDPFLIPFSREAFLIISTWKISLNNKLLYPPRLSQRFSSGWPSLQMKRIQATWIWLILLYLMIKLLSFEAFSCL